MRPLNHTVVIAIYPCSTGCISVDGNVITHRQASHIKGSCTTTCYQTELNKCYLPAHWWDWQRQRGNKRADLVVHTSRIVYQSRLCFFTLRKYDQGSANYKAGADGSG